MGIVKSVIAAQLCILLMSAVSSQATMVFWIEDNFSSPRLIKADQNGSIQSTLPLGAQSLPQALAIRPQTNVIYWTELSFINAHVKAVGPTLSDTGILVSLQSCARGIAIDSANNKIYWTSTNLSTGPGIFRSNPDGSSQEQIEFFGSSSTHTPFGIAINEKTQTLYWADFSTGVIEKDSAAALAPFTSAVTGLSGPLGVVIDQDSGNIFWTDANAGTIGRSTLTGANKATIVANCASPRYITLDKRTRRLFWTEYGSGVVRSANLDGTDTAIVAHTSYPPVGIGVVSDMPVFSNAMNEPRTPKTYSVSFSHGDRFSNAIVHIIYQLPKASMVSLELFDAQSRKVNSTRSSMQSAGFYQHNINLSPLAQGVYCIRFTADQFTSAIKYTRMK